MVAVRQRSSTSLREHFQHLLEESTLRARTSQDPPCTNEPGWEYRDHIRLQTSFRIKQRLRTLGWQYRDAKEMK